MAYTIKRETDGVWSSASLGDSAGWETLESAIEAAEKARLISEEWNAEFRICDISGAPVAVVPPLSGDLYWSDEPADYRCEATYEQICASIDSGPEGHFRLPGESVRSYVLLT